ncbi:MAG: M24 family metallopeptidase, partial [Planctomycetota bacterium]
QRAGIAAIRPGVEAKEVAAAARAVITKAGYGKALPHSVCHCVGLDVHDPAGGSLLEPGVVLTVEPGIYLPDEGIGIRIEDTVLVTKDGCDVLSKGVPKERTRIEQLMTQR